MLTLPTAATLKNKVGTLEEKGGKRGVEWKLGGQPQGASTCIQPELEGKVLSIASGLHCITVLGIQVQNSVHL